LLVQIECCEKFNINRKSELFPSSVKWVLFLFPSSVKWVLFVTSETIFSARLWGFIWLNKFLFMWQWERISNSCPECDSYISSSSVTSFTPLSPHHCHSNRPGINITSRLIFYFHPERDVGLQWRKWVLALTPFKCCFRFQTDDLVCAIHHPVKDFLFAVERYDPGWKTTDHPCWWGRVLNKNGDCFTHVGIFLNK